MHHPTDRITHTTAFVTPVVEHWLEREIAQWVHPMKDLSNDPSHHERMLLPRSYGKAGKRETVFTCLYPNTVQTRLSRDQRPTKPVSRLGTGRGVGGS